MTNEEAKKILNTVLLFGECDCSKEKIEGCLKTAIKALEQQSCEDAVSRKAVLDKLNRLIEVERLQGSDEMGYGRERVSAYESMIFEIESEYLYPPVTPQPKWIPVSERLPEEHSYVLVCTDANEIFIADYLGKMNDGTDCFNDNDGMTWEGNVIAWMPLPEPCKAESEG